MSRLAPGGPDSERGAIMILAAVSFVMVVFAAALSVDLGGQAVEKRKDQAWADLAALDGVRDLPNTAAATGDITASLQRNGLNPNGPGVSVSPTFGHFDPATGFQPGVTPLNADEVDVSTVYGDSFGGSSQRKSALAVAVANDLAGFLISSNLLTLGTQPAPSGPAVATPVNIPLGAGGSITGTITAFQPAQSSCCPHPGPLGTTASAAAVTLDLTATQLVSGIPGLGDTTVTLPLKVVVAGATGTLTNVDCQSSPHTIEISVAFTTASLTISGGVLPLPAPLAGSATIDAAFSVSGATSPPVTLTYPDNFLPSGQPIVATPTQGGLVKSNVTITGVPGPLAPTLQKAITIDLGVIWDALQSGLSTLGIQLTSADLIGDQGTNGLLCGQPSLAK